MDGIFSIFMKNLVMTEVTQECLQCGQEIAISNLRTHLNTCKAK